MSPEAQRIAIAETCGWSEVKPFAWAGYHKKWHPLSTPSDVREGLYHGFIPDYPNDLNAMHEAEKMMTKYQKLEYQEQLFRCGYKNGEHDGSFASWHYIHASAETRAEAFLRTLNLWVQS